MSKRGALAGAVLLALGSVAAQAQYIVSPGVHVGATPYGTSNVPYGTTFVPGYYIPNGQVTTLSQATPFTVPGAATQQGLPAVGPSVNPVQNLGQQNTVQAPANALQQVKPPSLPNQTGTSGPGTAAQKNVKGMLIEGTASVIDGDTFYVDQQLVVLYGADAPEIEQICWANGTAWRCGDRAKEELAKLIEGQQVSCIGQRPAGEAVAVVCRIPTGDLGRQMVAAGYALVPYELTRIYADAQEMAKGARRGVWAGEFQWPWDVRAKSTLARVAR